MKNATPIILGIFLSFVSLFSVANYFENGDKNAVLMYLMIYAIPLFILSLINGIVLRYAIKKKRFLKIFVFTFLPTLSLILIFTNDISLRFFGTIGIITYGITNFVGYLSLKEKDKASC